MNNYRYYYTIYIKHAHYRNANSIRPEWSRGAFHRACHPSLNGFTLSFNTRSHSTRHGRPEWYSYLRHLRPASQAAWANEWREWFASHFMASGSNGVVWLSGTVENPNTRLPWNDHHQTWHIKQRPQAANEHPTRRSGLSLFMFGLQLVIGNLIVSNYSDPLAYATQSTSNNNGDPILKRHETCKTFPTPGGRTRDIRRRQNTLCHAREISFTHLRPHACPMCDVVFRRFGLRNEMRLKIMVRPGTVPWTNCATAVGYVLQPRQG